MSTRKHELNDELRTFRKGVKAQLPSDVFSLLER